MNAGIGVRIRAIAVMFFFVLTATPAFALKQDQSHQLDEVLDAYLVGIAGYCRSTFGVVPELDSPDYVLDKRINPSIRAAIQDLKSADRHSRLIAMRFFYQYGLLKYDAGEGKRSARPCYGQYADSIHSALLTRLPVIDKEEEAYASAILLLIDRRDARAMKLLLSALSGRDSNLRKTAHQTIRVLSVSTNQIVDSLIAGLDDKDPAIVHASIESLSTIGPNARAAIPALVRLAKREDGAQLHSKEPSLRRKLLAAIGRIGLDRPETLAALRPVLFRPTQEEMIAGMDCLANIGRSAKSVGVELKPLLSSNNHLLRLNAARTLAGIDCLDNDVLKVLRAGLREKKGTVRLAAIQTVARVGPPARDCTPILVSLLQDDDVDIRLAAADALGHIGVGASQAIPALRELFASDPNDFRVARSAAIALAQIGPKALPTLTSIIKNSSLAGRDSAALALGLLGPDAAEATTALLEAFDSPDDAVRSCSAVALGRIGQKAKRALPQLDMIRRRDIQMEVRILANWAHEQINHGR
jgi:HEAT repeat protein